MIVLTLLLSSFFAAAELPGDCEADFTEVVSADGRTVQRISAELTVFSSPRSSLRVEVRRVPEPEWSHMRDFCLVDGARTLLTFRIPVVYLKENPDAFQFSADGEHLLMLLDHRTVFSRPLGRQLLDGRYAHRDSRTLLEVTADAFFLNDRTLVTGREWQRPITLYDLATEAASFPTVPPPVPDTRSFARVFKDGFRDTFRKRPPPPPKPYADINRVWLDRSTGWAVTAEADPEIMRRLREFRESRPNVSAYRSRVTLWDLNEREFAPHDVDLSFVLGLVPYGHVHELAHAEDLKHGRTGGPRPVAATTEVFHGLDAISLDEPGTWFVLARVFAHISWPGDPTIKKEVRRFVLVRASAARPTPDLVWLSPLYPDTPANLKLRRANGGIEVFEATTPETSVAIFAAK